MNVNCLLLFCLHVHLQVETSDGGKLKANFPDVVKLENSSKSPTKPPKALTKITQGHDPGILQQAVKYANN